MPVSSGVRAYVTADSRGQALVLSDDACRDGMQVSGRWVRCEHPVEVRL